jgi:hypothetical protein
MRDRPLRGLAVVGLFVGLSLARDARAQADGGAPNAVAPVPGAGLDAGGSAGPADTGPPGPSPSPDTGTGLFEQSLSANGSGTKSDSGAGAAPLVNSNAVALSGYLRGDMFVGKAPGAREATMKAATGELALVLRTAKTSYGDGFGEVRMRHGLQGQERRTVVDVREAYVNAYVGRIDLRLGQQIIVWGRADALNPTNNLTPVDFRIRSPLEDDIRLGNVGARGFLRLAPLRLEGVWMPVYLPTELPNVGVPQFVAFGAPVFPSPGLRHGLGAGRLHLELPAFEMSVSYLVGYAPMPGLTLTGLTFDPTNPSVLVSRTAYNQQVVGFDFSTALGDILTIRGEAAYRRPFDYQNRPYAARPDLQYVLGADRSFGSLTVILQYMGRYVFDWRKEPGPIMDLNPAILRMNPDPIINPDIDYWTEAATDAINAQLAKTNQILFSQTARIQHVATVRFEWLAAHETLSISSLCMLNVTTREWLVMPRIGYRLSDAMVAYVGAQIFAGPDDTLFGLIDQELSAGYTELRYTF